MKKILIVTVVALLLLLLGYEGCKSFQGTDAQFKATIDSLHRMNDSLIARSEEHTSELQSH